MSMEESKNN
jgi:hypothetical protein